MIMVVREWMSSRSVREQRLLMAMTAIAAVLLVWLLVFRPVNLAYATALERHLEAIDRNGKVKSMANANRGATPPPANRGGSDITLVLAERAAQSGLVLVSNDAAGPNDASVSIGATKAIAVSQWLSQLEQDGFEVRELAMTPTPDGNVAVTARLVRRDR